MCHVTDAADRESADSGLKASNKTTTRPKGRRNKTRTGGTDETCTLAWPGNTVDSRLGHNGSTRGGGQRGERTVYVEWARMASASSTWSASA